MTETEIIANIAFILFILGGVGFCWLIGIRKDD